MSAAVEHGVTAFYAGGPGEPYYQPVLECLCGFSSGRCEDWQEAGAAMDDHIRITGKENDAC